MAVKMIGGRPSKAALARMKTVTVGVSIVAFLGSLGVIASNGTGNAATTTAAQTETSQVAFTGQSSTVTRQRSFSSTTSPQPGFSAPLTRSRGS